MALYLKTFQALSYERLQGALSDLVGLTLSQDGLMNLLRRGQHRFAGGRESAVSALPRAAVVASDETGVRIEGCNGTHWVFRCAEVDHGAPPIQEWVGSTTPAGLVEPMVLGRLPTV